MEPSNINQLLRDLESPNSASLLQKRSVETPMSEEQKQQHLKDLKTIETEIGIAESSLNKIAIDWSQVPQVRQRAETVVEDLKAIETRTLRHAKEISISAERTAAFVSDLKGRANIIDKLFNANDLVYDNTAEMNPILEEATHLKNHIIAQVVEATTEFDVQGLVLYITKVLEARHELSNRLLERDASFSLYDDAARNLAIVKKEHARVLEERDRARASLEAKRLEGDRVTSEAKSIQDQIEATRLEISKASLSATAKQNQHANQLALIQQKTVILEELRNCNAAKRSKLAEMKGQFEKLQTDHAQKKKTETEKAALELAHLRSERDDAMKRRDEVTRMLQVTNNELRRVERIHEQIALREAGDDDLSAKLQALEQSIRTVRKEKVDFKQRTDSHKQMLEAKLAARKAAIGEVSSRVDEKKKKLEADRQKAAALVLALAAKKLELEQEQNIANELVCKSPEGLQILPVFTSTPLSVKEKTARKQVKSPKTKKRASRGRRH